MAKQDKPSNKSENIYKEYKNQIPDFKYTPEPPKESSTDSDSKSDSNE